MGKLSLIIDTDCGVDDAEAILLALSSADKCDIVGITCVDGNTSLENVGPNVLRVLKVSHIDNIPVFKGAERGLIATKDTPSSASTLVHGNDGFGGISHTIPVDASLIDSQHAVQWMVDMVKSKPKQITMIALGPLTNLALAVSIDPEFGSNLRELFVMGGNHEGRGNVTVASEFNFHCDPEAAYSVLNNFSCPITLITWETCAKHQLSWDWYDQLVNSKSNDSENGKFLRQLRLLTDPWRRSKYPGGFFSCDLLAMAVCLNFDVLVKDVENVYVTVELSGSNTRGQCVVDWNGTLNHSPNAKLVLEVNCDTLKKIYEKLVN